jgi:hypothetical protein
VNQWTQLTLTRRVLAEDAPQALIGLTSTNEVLGKRNVPSIDTPTINWPVQQTSDLQPFPADTSRPG